MPKKTIQGCNIAAQVPRPPRKDFYKLMNRDRIVLRFAVRLVETPGYPLSETDRWAAILQ